MAERDTKCPYADRAQSASGIRCSALRERNAKWDFCILQYFCRASGTYKIRSEDCQIRRGR